MKQKAKSQILDALRKATIDETQAVEFMEQQRWGGEPTCPRCGYRDVYVMTGQDGNRNKDYRWRCRGCKKMYTVRTNTVFEETRLPMRVWVFAFWQACASKKGISALQLAREMEVTHKSALYVLRRIRHGLGDHMPKKLEGTIEVDETYCGGRPRFKGQSKVGRGTSKAPVLGIVQRSGDVRFRMLERVTAKQLRLHIAENADLSCRMISDEWPAYRTIGRAFKGGHEVVRHSAGEYVRRDKPEVHTNTIEGTFSLLKRGLIGTFHSISKKHLPNYLNEFEFRHNTRAIDDDARVVAAIRKVDGKRLQYRESVDRPPYAVSTST